MKNRKLKDGPPKSGNREWKFAWGNVRVCQLRKPWIFLAGANEKKISWSRRHAHFIHDF